MGERERERERERKRERTLVIINIYFICNKESLYPLVPNNRIWEQWFICSYLFQHEYLFNLEVVLNTYILI